MNKKLSKKELIRRLLIINEELDKLNNAIEEQKIDIHVNDSHGCGIATYLTNISICSDIDDLGLPKDIDGYRVESEWRLNGEV